MAYTINAYDADVRIPQFMGLKQYGDLMNGNPIYAAHCVNVNTKGGTLMPMAAPISLPGSLEAPIETLMKVNRRWAGSGPDEMIVAASGGKLYVYDMDEQAWSTEAVTMPSGMEQFGSNVWSWVDYEITPDGEDTPHDVILLSNAADGMFMFDSQELTITAVTTPYKFGVITRHAERIWGSAIIDEPDKLVYSRPYLGNGDLSIAWEEAGPEEQPEDGAGEIDQPSWDGDSFMALRTFGDQLIAFKRTRVWRVLGTNPGEYEFKEQYGGGSYVAATVAVDSQRIYMLGQQGIMCYDGATVEPFGKEYAYTVWNRMNREHMDEACACIWRDKYYIAVPLDDSISNNAVVTYDMHDGTWLMRTDLQIESWLPAENALYFTTVDDPYSVRQYREDAWETGEAIEAEQIWISPWNDLGYPHKSKGPFKFFFAPEVQDKPADFTIIVDTERGSRSKEVKVYPIKGHEERMNYDAKTIRVPFAGHGRKFRVTIKAKGGAVWRICGGIVLNVDQETED